MDISFWEAGTRIATWPDHAHIIPRTGDYILLTKDWRVDKILWINFNTVRLELVAAGDP
jgi:hypothetical protein